MPWSVRLSEENDSPVTTVRTVVARSSVKVAESQKRMVLSLAVAVASILPSGETTGPERKPSPALDSRIRRPVAGSITANCRASPEWLTTAIA